MAILAREFIMKRILNMAFIPLLLAAGGAFAANAASSGMDAGNQTLARKESRPSFTGPEQTFTGKVEVEMLFSPVGDLPASGAYVSFDAGARSAWHTHPAGQTLIVTAGHGRTQEWGGPVVEIRPGDVIRCPAGVKHWHGAAPDSPMTHLAITGDVNGKNVEWMEKVSDSQYHGKQDLAASAVDH